MDANEFLWMLINSNLFLFRHSLVKLNGNNLSSTTVSMMSDLRQAFIVFGQKRQLPGRDSPQNFKQTTKGCIKFASGALTNS